MIFFATNLFSKQISYKLISSDTLESGAIYQYYEMGTRSKKLKIHVAKMARNSDLLDLRPHLVNDYGTKLGSIIEYDSTHPKSLVSINASFFQGGTHLPVGITVIDKEIVQLKKYKQWSSIIFTDNGIYLKELDAFAKIKFNKSEIEIDRFNYRSDTNQLVAYNSFYSSIYPNVNDEEIDSLYINFLKENSLNSLAGDETEAPMPFSEFKKVYQSTFNFDSTHNYFYFKAIPIDPKSIGKSQRFLVKNYDKLPITIGKGEIVFESKVKLPLFDNDTIALNISLNIDLDSIEHIISATPIILKNGKEYINSRYEGANSRRFNSDHLSRTAFGFNDNYYYMVAVEPNQGRNVKGATLKELSWIMETIGCKNAINLDGGGSTTFVMDKQNLAFPYSLNYNRKVSTAFSIFKK